VAIKSDPFFPRDGAVKFAISILLCGALGCATVSTWEATGRADIEIARIEICDSSADIVDEYSAVVYGTKTVPLIPGLIATTHEGMVDKICTDGLERKLIVDVSRMRFNDDCGVDIVSSDNVFAETLDGDRQPVSLRQPGGFLLSDLSRWENQIAIPIRKENLCDGQELWTVKILEKPCIGYGKRSYMIQERGTGTTMKRVMFVPIAVAVDGVTLPFQMILGLFVHM